jgi:diguanylate cyclase (GGDEF)-like protein
MLISHRPLRDSAGRSRANGTGGLPSGHPERTHMTLVLPPDFERAGHAVLDFLHRRLGFSLWMVTRVQGDDFIILQSEGAGYGVSPGTVIRWADSFCSQMVKGNGPRVAPDSEAVPAYAAAPVGRQVPIKAYIGVPLTHADGRLFGTLCAIDPARQPEAIVEEQELIELLASMLSAILDTELKLSEAVRRSEHLELEALVDPLTSLLNRRAWDRLIAREDERCRRYGHTATVFVIDLDQLKEVNDTAGHAAGDALLVRAATALREVVRDVDIVARLGGDEFGLIAVECDAADAELLLARLRSALDARQVRASVGLSVREPTGGLKKAWDQADRLMYAQKRTQWPLSLTIGTGGGFDEPPRPRTAGSQPDVGGRPKRS